MLDPQSVKTLGLVGVRRDKGVRTTIPAKDGTGSATFTYVRTWAPGSSTTGPYKTLADVEYAPPAGSAGTTTADSTGRSE